MKYFVGLDLGKLQDPSAIVVTERSGERPPYAYTVPYLERFPLHTSYPDIVDATQALLLMTPLFGQAQLAIDLTGVGLAIADLFRLKNQPFIGVMITGGTSWHREHWDQWNISKHLLVSNTQKILSSGLLSINQSLPQAAVLKEELRDFRVKISKAATEVYEAREGSTDDLTLALSIALFVGEQYIPVQSW